MMKRFFLISTLMFMTFGTPSFAGDISGSRFFQPPNATVSYFEARITLPLKGGWAMDDSQSSLRLIDGFIELVDPEKYYKKEGDNTPRPETAEYRLVAVTDRADVKRLELSLKNAVTGEARSVVWDLPSSQLGDAEIMARYKGHRGWFWKMYYNLTKSPVLRAWNKMADTGSDEAGYRHQEDLFDEKGLDYVFGVLGGGAAVCETLQMDLLAHDVRDEEERTVPVGSIKGVDVKSHPYEKLLNGRTAPAIELASRVPRDRFFLYMANPETVMGFMEKGMDFISRTGRLITGDGLDYGLKEKYLERLGIDPTMMKRFIDSGYLKESVLTTSDLFFADGTDITILAKVNVSKKLMVLLGWAGVVDLPQNQIVERVKKNNGSSYWMIAGDMLVIGTNRKEVESVRALCDAKGRNSLGESAEFRYMMSMLPKTDNTVSFAYFSDPFIRRLVSPEVKIGQLRRSVEKGKVEIITAASLLARSQGLKGFDSVDQLVGNKYLPEFYSGKGFSIDPGGSVRSAVYGKLGNMTGLLSVPVVKATRSEAELYRGYLENYNKYWSEYYDPIAIRIDEPKSGEYQADLFILPLIENSFYDDMKQYLVMKNGGSPLKFPVFSWNPVLQFGMNISPEVKEKFIREFGEIFLERSRIGRGVIDDLGPFISLSVADAEPVIVLGTGDLLGLFNVDSTDSRSEKMMSFVPLLNLLTRPCTLAIETKNPENTLRYLINAASPNGGWYLYEDISRDDFRITYARVEESNSFVCTLSVADIIKLRLYITVNQGMVLVSNTPEARFHEMTGINVSRSENILLDLNPSACDRMRSGLFTAYSETEQEIVRKNMGLIYPLLKSGYTGLEGVDSAMMTLFGYKTKHPEEGHWVYRNMNIESSAYGTVFQNRIPAWDGKRKRFGIFKDVKELNVGLRFEDKGLRTSIRWKTASGTKE
jgi:hypothetical protein